jgi:hypothetical protein
MKKRSRPGLPTEPGAETDSRRTGRRSKPLVYPVLKRTTPTAGKGVIDMSVRQFVSLAVLFVLLACVATSATTFAVIELAGGVQGEQGVQGIQGERGPAGTPGKADVSSQEMIKRLATLWAVQQTSSLQGGSFVSLNDPRVDSCVEYVLTGNSGAGACAGFSGSSQ